MAGSIYRVVWYTDEWNSEQPPKRQPKLHEMFRSTREAAEQYATTIINDPDSHCGEVEVQRVTHTVLRRLSHQ